jgi:peptidoglycan L-alanyl-D-glutamate endopeptidase CwlK
MDKISIDRLEELHPKYKGLFKEFYSRVVTEVPLENGFWRVVQGFRSPEYQDGLYAIGRTKPGKIVTNCQAWQSPHNYGVGIDVGHIDGKNLVDFTQKELTSIVKIAKEMKLICGIDFKSKDSPHFEINNFDWRKFKVKLKDKDGWII